MSEAQKYQGALYKEKPTKNQKKGQNNQNNQKQVANAKQNPNGRHQQPRVEDGSDGEGLKTVLPPPAPTPPPIDEVRTPAPANDKPVNVFDYLVAEETPNASKVTLAEPKEQMTMKTNAKSVFEPSESLARFEANPTTDDEGKNYDVAYNEHGFSYGAGSIPHSNSPPNISTEFVTPAPKKKKDRKEKAPGTVSEKKRKRGQPEALSTPREEVDTPMMEAPSSIINNAGTPMLRHSGLTGGLNRMMRSPSPGDDSPETHRRAYQDTSSPIKRSRRNGKEANGHGDSGLGISMKNRAERLVSSMFGGSVVSSTSGTEPNHKTVVRARRGSDSSAEDQLEVRKSKKSHRSRASPEETRKSKRKSSNPTDDRPTRRLKQIDERRGLADSTSHQVTVYNQSKQPARTDEDLQRELAHHFLSFVPSGAAAERGFSINKTLKRFHRDLSGDDRERRLEDEKDLWRALRLGRNDRGEIVVFI
jgi:cell growth-regulating nucleolar protein